MKEQADVFDAAGRAAEDWTSLRLLCRACSEGSAPHDDHDHHGGTGEWTPERTIGISADPEQARALLDRWVAAGASRSYAGGVPGCAARAVRSG